jgi:hypothetical protein
LVGPTSMSGFRQASAPLRPPKTRSSPVRINVSVPASFDLSHLRAVIVRQGSKQPQLAVEVIESARGEATRGQSLCPPGMRASSRGVWARPAPHQTRFRVAFPPVRRAGREDARRPADDSHEVSFALVIECAKIVTITSMPGWSATRFVHRETTTLRLRRLGQ